jgi:hypothetical protein
MNENLADAIGILAIGGCIATVVWLGAALSRDSNEGILPQVEDRGSDPLDPW